MGYIGDDSQQRLLEVLPNQCHTMCYSGGMGNSTIDFSTGLGSFNLGNGLVEIAALTSLVGSATAQALALGTKGAAGLVWSTMTIFGVMSVVRAGLGTITPGWLRDSLGVRSAEIDAAVGLSLNLNKDRIRYRARAGVARGIECETTAQLKDPIELARRDTQVFNQRIQNILSVVPSSQPGDSLKVHYFTPDPYHKASTLYYAWQDRFGLLLSTIKLAEVGLLWRYDSVSLAGVTFVTWLFYFLAGLILHIHGRMQELKSKNGSEIDIISGSLPTPSKAGDSRRVLVGIPRHPRQFILWKIIWALGSLVCVVSVLMTYMALGQTKNLRAFFIWTGFQILWLALRSTFFHIAEDQDRPYQPSLQGKPWTKVGSQERERVRRLVFALAKYQIHIHPRGAHAYTEDVQSLGKLDNLQAKYPFDPTNNATAQIEVQGVIGDTMLSSVSWIFGSKKGGFDFYDTCIVILKLKEATIAIPAARVRPGVKSASTPDPEQGDELERPPRGSSHIMAGTAWAYWIPAGRDRWLYFLTKERNVKGERTAIVLSDEQVTERLEARELFVSLRHVNEVKEIVESSTYACQYLQELLECQTVGQ